MPGDSLAVTVAALLMTVGAIALVAAAGLGCARFLGADGSSGEIAAWSWGAGTLLLTALYAALLAAGASPGPKKLGVVLAGVAIPGILRRREHRGKRGAARDGVVFLFAALAAAGCAAYALQAVAEPLWSTDFLALWGWKGKTIFLSGAIPARLFRDPATAWSHPEYPLFVPLAMASLSALTRSWNDETLGLLYAVWQIATVLAIFGYVRRRATPRAGALVAAIVAWFHPLYRGFGVGLADVPFALAVVLLAIAAAEHRPREAAAAAFLAAATKQEGSLLAAIVALLLIAVAGRDRDPKQRHDRAQERALLLRRRREESRGGRLARTMLRGRDREEHGRQGEGDVGEAGAEPAIQRMEPGHDSRGGGSRARRRAPADVSEHGEDRRDLPGGIEKAERLVVPRARQRRERRHRERDEKRVFRMRPGGRRIVEKAAGNRSRQEDRLPFPTPEREEIGAPERLRDGLKSVSEAPGGGDRAEQNRDPVASPCRLRPPLCSSKNSGNRDGRENDAELFRPG